MKLVTTDEMRQAEQLAVEAGDTWEDLMARAGQAVADQVLARLGDDVEGRQVLALAGPGNNGGDALVAARHLAEAGMAVSVYLWNRQGEEDDPLIKALAPLDVTWMRDAEDEKHTALRRQLKKADVVIDGLLGMGLQRPVEGRLRDVVEQVNQAEQPLVVAVDLPTGVHADSGQVLGAAVRASLTVTMSNPKRGLYQFPGAGYAGEIVVAEIGIAQDLLKDVSVELLDPQKLGRMLPERPRDAHKGTFGRLLVIAGSLHYTGAPHLAAMGAYRVGAGLVTVAPPRTIYPVLAASVVEATFLPLPEAEFGAIGEDAIKVVAEAIGRYNALVLGPGLGQHEGTAAFVRRLLHALERTHSGIGFLPRLEQEELEWELPPMVIDADALNILAGVPEWWRSLPAGQAVLTPHPGEMARLLGASQKEVLATRVAVAQRAAATWGQVVVFKGANTVVAHPDGRVVVNPVATPVLASAGTGDVLSGAIAGFLAQGVAPYEAAQLGVYLHALAGQILGEEIGEVGGVAGEVGKRLPAALQKLRRQE